MSTHHTYTHTDLHSQAAELGKGQAVARREYTAYLHVQAVSTHTYSHKHTHTSCFHRDLSKSLDQAAWFTCEGFKAEY